MRLRLVEDAHGLAGQLALSVEILSGRDALIAEAHERRGELPIVGANSRLEIPIARRAECDPFFLAFDDEADRYALDSSSAETGLHFLPEHR